MLKVIRRHTGANASDTVPFRTSEVLEMWADAWRDGRLSVEERLTALSALQTFGGNKIHPNIFQHPQFDKAVLTRLAMTGIEDAAGFNRLSAADRGTFLFRAAVIGDGALAGLVRKSQSTDRDNFAELDFGDASEGLVKLVDDRIKGFTGQGPLVDGSQIRVEVDVITHQQQSLFGGSNQVYGYLVKVAAQTADGKGSFYSEDIATNKGELAKAIQNEFEPFASE